VPLRGSTDRGDFALSRQHRQKSLNLLGSHVARMRHLAVATMPAEVKTYPVEVGFFSTQALVKVTDPLPDLVKQA